VHGPNPCTHRKPLPLSKSPPPIPPIFDSKAPPSPLPSPPPPRPEEERKRKGRQGEKWGKGGRGPEISPCPSLSKASPAPSLGRAAKCLSLVYITQSALPRDQKKPSGQHNFFPTTPNSNFFFPPQRYYIGPPSFKISDLRSCF
jgi:hypothetical protein